MTEDPTRLLVLGATRQEQPASRYPTIRELTGWGVAEWASVNLGSTYGAFRALVKDRHLHQEQLSPAKSDRHRPSTIVRVILSEPTRLRRSRL